MRHDADLRNKLTTISQEQAATTESVGLVRMSLSALVAEVRQLEDRIATLEAAQTVTVTGGIAGKDGVLEVTMTALPEWD